jgi:hypothetical protein
VLADNLHAGCHTLEQLHADSLYHKVLEQLE